MTPPDRIPPSLISDQFTLPAESSHSRRRCMCGTWTRWCRRPPSPEDVSFDVAFGPGTRFAAFAAQLRMQLSGRDGSDVDHARELAVSGLTNVAGGGGRLCAFRLNEAARIVAAASPSIISGAERALPRWCSSAIRRPRRLMRCRRIDDPRKPPPSKPWSAIAIVDVAFRTDYLAGLSRLSGAGDGFVTFRWI